MADVGQGEIADNHQVEGIIAPPEEEDDIEVTLDDCCPPMMTMKEKVMLPQTVKIRGSLSSQPHQLYQIDRGDLVLLRALCELIDLRHWWPLHPMHMSDALFSL